MQRLNRARGVPSLPTGAAVAAKTATEAAAKATAKAASVRVDGGAVIVTFHDAGPLGISFGSQSCCVCDSLPSISTVYLAMCRTQSEDDPPLITGVKARSMASQVGLGRVVALYHRSSTSYQIR
jgi:hypothetical protein